MGKRAKIRHAFISYSRDDKVWTYEFAKALRDDLALYVFVDYEIHVGTKWWQVICENIESCDYFIYIMSPRSIESIYCTAEVEYALALNKPIFPVMYKPCTYPNLLGQNQIQYLTLTDKMQLPQTLLALQKGFFDAQTLIYEGEFAIPNPPPPYPDEPKPYNSQSAEEVYHLAIDAQKLDFDRAIRLFEQVIVADKSRRWGRLAQKRLDETKSYQEVARMLPKSLRDARDLWHEHITEFGAEIDPLGFAVQLAGTQPTPPSPTPVVVPTLKPAAEPIPKPAVMPTPKSAFQPPSGTEATRLLRQIDDPKTTPALRLEIGKKLAEIGDPRIGVGTMTVNGITLPQLLWCLVPKGEFIMGNDTSNQSDEKPQHTLTLPDFYMSRYLITYAQYQAFENAPDFADDRWWMGFPEGEKRKKYDQNWKYANHPRENVTWYGAMAFGRWITHHTQQLQLPMLQWDNTARKIIEAPYQHAKITLPSEAEYEKMAGGTKWLIYPYGNSFDPNKGNTESTGLNMTSAVGVFPQGESPYGVLDACGNVWTWTRSKYKSYKYNNNNGREDEKEDGKNSRSLRGGSWGSVRDDARVSYRLINFPYFRGNIVGFFVACLRF